MLFVHMQMLQRNNAFWGIKRRPSTTSESIVMEDLSVTLKSLVLLVVVLALLIGTLVVSPVALVVLVVALAWANLAGLMVISRI